MKGVIVEVGEPKSIVLFNSGKIRAIPSPADCHVGMVVTVKLNNKLKIAAAILAAIFLVAFGVFIGTALRDGASGRALGIPMREGGYGRVTEKVHPEENELRRGRETERSGRIEAVSVAEAKNLPDDTPVALTGNITEQLGDEKYTFRDASGEITVEIEKKVLRDFSGDISGEIEIRGEVELERRELIIDVKSIGKK